MTMRFLFRQAAQMAAFFVAMTFAGAANSLPTLNWTIDCSRGQSISHALKHAFPGMKLTLTVRGTCREFVAIARDDVTLRGETGAMLIAPDESGPTIRIEGTRVVVDGLTVTRGAVSVSIAHVFDVEIANSTVQGAAGDCVRVIAGHARILNSTIQGCGRDGVRLNQASALVANSLVGSNTNAGVALIGNSGIQLSDSTITANGSSGLSLEASTADVYGTTISANGANPTLGSRYGVFAKSSRLSIHGGAIDSNAWSGIQMETGSAATIQDASVTANGKDMAVIENLRRGVSLSQSTLDIVSSSVTNNSGRGVAIEDRSSANLNNTAVTGNGSHGVEAYLASSTSITGGTVAGNGDSGVWLWVNSTAQITGGATIRGNVGHGVDLNADSKLWVFDPISVGGNAGFGVFCNDARSSAANLAFIAFTPANGGGAANCNVY
jgi:hypothetical protein